MAEACDPWDDELAGYAVGALTVADAKTLEAHLAGCSRCAARLRWLSPAVDALSATAQPETPSAQLRGRILETVYAEAGAARRVERRTHRGERIAAGRERLRRRLAIPALRPAVATLAVVVLVLAGLAGYVIRGGEGERTIALQPTAAARSAVAELSIRDNVGTLSVRGLAALPAGEVYQAWVAVGTEIQPSSVFVVDRDAQAAVAIPTGLDGADEVLVTREPAGGSEQPTGPPLLRASLS